MQGTSDWKHDDLAIDLAAHLRAGTSRMIWTNMQLGPVGSPRPDVFTIARTFTALSSVAYEVKISRADFRRDVTEGKWQSYRKFASSIVFAVPAGLIAPSEVPDSCGLLVRGPAGWRATRKPTPAPIDNLPATAWLKLLMDGIERERTCRPDPESERRNAYAGVSRRWGATLAAALHAAEGAEEYLETRRRVAMKRTEELESVYSREYNRIAEKARADAQALSIEHDALAAMLGLPTKVAAFDLMQALRQERQRLSESAEVARLTRMVNLARRALGCDS